MNRYEFARSLLFWIRGSVCINDFLIDLELTHCFFVFPIGKHREQIPLDTVSSVGLDMSYNPQMAFMALLGIIAGGFILFMGYWIGLLSVFCGSLFILAGIETVVSIHKSGTKITFGVPFFERGKIKEMTAMLENAVFRYRQKELTGADRIVEAIKER
jgi:hypothetical protein